MKINEKKLRRLFEKYQNDRERYFVSFYDYTSTFLYGVSLTVLHSPPDASDNVQNVFLKIHLLPDDNFPRTNCIAWLYRVCKNSALDLVKKRLNCEPIENLHIPVSSNIDKIIGQIDYNQLLQTLTIDEREIVNLKIVAGFTHKQISNLIGIPLGTVQWKYNNALKKLRKAIKGQS